MSASTKSSRRSLSYRRQHSFAPLALYLFVISAVITVPKATATASNEEKPSVERNLATSAVSLQINTDSRGEETSWRLESVDSGATIDSVASGTYERNRSYTKTFNLEKGDFKFIFFDSYGDGICCSQGDGFYTIYIDGEEVLSGGRFQKAIEHVIRVKHNPKQTMSNIDKEWLRVHNVRRREFHEENGVSYVPLLWSDALKEDAKNWVEHLMKECGKIVKEASSNGQNMVGQSGAGAGSLDSPNYVLERWSDNRADSGYPWNSSRSQVMWRASRFLGCASGIRNMGNGEYCERHVCRYVTAGNCSMGKYNAKVGDNWKIPTLLDTSPCGELCPRDGCYVSDYDGTPSNSLNNPSDGSASTTTKATTTTKTTNRPTEPATTRTTTTKPSTTEPTSGVNANANKKKVLIEINTDGRGDETSFSLTSVASGKTVASSPKEKYANNKTYKQSLRLRKGKYLFRISDTYGDGVCCSQGKGSYAIYVDGQEILRGGRFGKEESYIINVGYKSQRNMNTADKAWLKAHNKRRKNFYDDNGVDYKPLKWSNDLKKKAEAWVEKLLDGCNPVAPEPGTQNGQNLFGQSGNAANGEKDSPEQVLTRWVEKKMNASYPQNKPMIQVFWKGSSYVGCASGYSVTNGQYCERHNCQYVAAGNCNIGKYNPKVGDNWKTPTLMDESFCGEQCPNDGCHDSTYDGGVSS